ncbi:MAG TPA: heme biosynthesis HemY N-terminal domain-containing protein [Alphaproteobacteria bacterium]|nr:heme biosynthesis HemY N-terminal domain-containing protein [Alphaproteobacteria bacterium]
MRATLALVLIALLAAAIAWLVGQPGQVSLVWHGWRVDTSVGVLLGIVLLIAIAAAALYRFWRFLRRAPGALLRRRRESRRLKGYRALTQGLVAVAAGDAAEAQRQARRADLLLKEPPLTMLLSAQAAQLEGDEAAAENYFHEMLKRPETEFLGLRGLTNLATKRGDVGQALGFVRRARELRPKTGWVLSTLYELETKAGDWQAAEETARRAARARAIAPEEGARKRAVALYQQSLADAVLGHVDEARARALKAVELAPGLVPAATRAATLLGARGKKRRARHLLEEAWERSPHPDLVATYLALGGESEPLKRLLDVQRLVAHRPVDAESHIALAEAALAARLWGEARKALESLRDGADAPRSARVCRLWARLEESEHGDGPAAREWLARAAHAEPDRAWTCARCGAAHAAWEPVCRRCGAYDTLEWRNPAEPAPAVLELGAEATPRVAPAARALDPGPTPPPPAEAVTDLGN